MGTSLMCLKTRTHIVEVIDFIRMASKGMRGTAWNFEVGNGQACPSERGSRCLPRNHGTRCVTCAAPTHQFATRELSFHPRGVFLMLIMEALQKEFALFD